MEIEKEKKENRMDHLCMVRGCAMIMHQIKFSLKVQEAVIYRLIY